MRTFFPRTTATVDASSHGEGAEYSIGIGSEMWADGPAHVLKVQMSYGGQVAGRKAPSFPIVEEKRDGSNFRCCPDFDDVAIQIERMIDPLRRWLITWDRPPGGNDVSSFVVDAIKNVFHLGDKDLERPCLQVRTIEIQAGGDAGEVARRLSQEMRKLKAPPGTKIYAARVAEQGDASV